jgi:hypothetical protein
MCTQPEVTVVLEPQRNGRPYPSCLNNRSESIGKLVFALAAAQKEYKPIKRTSENYFYSTDTRKAMYAELQDVIAATQPALCAHGLVIIQRVSSDATRYVAIIETILAHKSGEWMANVLELPATAAAQRWNDEIKRKEWYRKFDSQTIGSAFTYGRRYSWQAMTGVSSEPDDDANAVSEAVQHGSAEAAQAIANEKIAKLKQKLGNGVKTGGDLERTLQASVNLAKGESVGERECEQCHHATECTESINKPCPNPYRVLFVTHDFKNNAYDISGMPELMEETGWSKFVGLNGEEVADLSYACERIGITLKKLKPNR